MFGAAKTSQNTNNQVVEALKKLKADFGENIFIDANRFRSIIRDRLPGDNWERICECLIVTVEKGGYNRLKQADQNRKLQLEVSVIADILHNQRGIDVAFAIEVVSLLASLFSNALIIPHQSNPASMKAKAATPKTSCMSVVSNSPYTYYQAELGAYMQDLNEYMEEMSSYNPYLIDTDNYASEIVNSSSIDCTDDRLLRKMALDSVDSQFHIEAIRKLTNQKFIKEIAMESVASQVHIEAIRKLTDQRFIKEIAMESVASQVHIEAIRKLTDQKFIKEIAMESVDSQVHIEAIRKLTDQKFIKEIALESVDSRVYIEAVKKITDRKLLMEIYDDTVVSNVKRMIQQKLGV